LPVVASDYVKRSALFGKVKVKNMPTKKLQLDIERIEDIVADRLAEILVMQLDWQKLRAQEKAKNKKENQNQYGKRKIHNQ